MCKSKHIYRENLPTLSQEAGERGSDITEEEGTLSGLSALAPGFRVHTSFRVTSGDVDFLQLFSLCSAYFERVETLM